MSRFAKIKFIKIICIIKMDEDLADILDFTDKENELNYLNRSDKSSNEFFSNIINTLDNVEKVQNITEAFFDCRCQDNGSILRSFGKIFGDIFQVSYLKHGFEVTEDKIIFILERRLNNITYTDKFTYYLQQSDRYFDEFMYSINLHCEINGITFDTDLFRNTVKKFGEGILNRKYKK